MSEKNIKSEVPKSLKYINEFIKDSAIINNLIMRKQSLEGIENIPVTIFPSPFSSDLFSNVTRLQKDFHLLFNKLSNDYEELYKILQKVIDTDDFIRKIWNIFQIVQTQPNRQNTYLGLIRNDYMISLPSEYQSSDEDLTTLVLKPGVSIKQIEYNLMASSFPGIAQKVLKFHKLNLQLTGTYSNEFFKSIPCNAPANGFAKGIICAWQVYNKPHAAILFLINGQERNIYDQRILEQCIYEQNPSVRVLRKTFEECLSEGRLESDNSFWIDEHEIAVIYFRHGYAPDHFYNETIWESKLMLEKSIAIKCPSIQYMLVNTKLVQQSLSNYSFLKKYLSDVVARELIETFANQYLLTDTDKVESALQFPEKYVLKPQREGGGNNFFDDELVQKLKEIKDTDEKYQFVLMERIYPATCKSYILESNGEITKQTIVSELGIYGVFLGNENEVFANYQCGHLLRSKSQNVKESGIAAGFGCIDSPYLV